MKKCEKCGRTLADSAFANGSEYVNKKGEKIRYKRRICKPCYSGYYQDSARTQKRDRIHSLLSWAAPLLLTIVVGIYQSDSVSGRVRTCTYVSVYGSHSVSIDSMNMCPLTWEFEV